MSGPTYPLILQAPFAHGGAKNVLPYPSTGITGVANWNDGFPAITMTPVSSGGIPPSGLDFNGVLNELSASIIWSNCGGQFSWDASFAAGGGIGSALGYPNGAKIQAAGNKGNWFLCLRDGVTTDPDTFANVDRVNWVPVDGTAYGVGNFCSVLTAGLVDIGIVASPAITVLYPGMRFAWVQAGGNNTGASTLDVGTGSHPLVRSDNQPTQANDLVLGQLYEAQWNGTNMVLKQLVPSQALCPVGMIAPYAGASIPAGWLGCDGTNYLGSSYAALYAAIGTAYGNSGGVGHFNVPDLVNAFPLGASPAGSVGTYPNQLGDTGGEATHTLSIPELPSHTHAPSITDPITCHSNPSPIQDGIPGGAGWGDETLTIASVGGGSAHNNVPPFLAINFIIKF